MKLGERAGTKGREKQKTCFFLTHHLSLPYLSRPRGKGYVQSRRQSKKNNFYLFLFQNTNL
ncbi:MAG: hypothetical protein EAZ95_08540 [Bacteroidetes bacterium]|nr:MAG: hypothetical protein EAZ95_08540 [Bacteroidota bacterium]